MGPGRDADSGAASTSMPVDGGSAVASGTGVPGGGASRAAGQIATSPAVGVFQPGPRAVAGTRVRAGDPIGVVDMLGVPQEVVAPVDGIVIGVIVDGGTAVEYGQELVQLQPAVAAEGR
ncbi:MAG TPA: biotin/lipoyl-containing protein [Candidatus Limnocylindrales bacterium]